MGFIEEDPAILDPARLGDLVGPSVHLHSFSSDSGAWQGSVQIACKDQQLENLSLSYSVGASPAASVAGQLLLTYENWIVVRFPITAILMSEEQVLKYVIQLPKARVNPEGAIRLPTRDKAWRVVGYSCNDQRQQKKVGTACWQKFNELHKESPIHVLMGTGDQLYNDNVWNGPLIRKWFDIKDKQQRVNTPLSPEQLREVEAFYFFSYMRFLAFHPMGAATLASMPQVNTWDDHDIFDGWGSYPVHLQTCAAFRAVFDASFRNYLVFQQHTNRDLMLSDGFFGAPGCSWLIQMGPELAVAAVDTRSERTRDLILPAPRVEEFFSRASRLPPTVKHLVYISAVPIAYPEVSVIEGGLAMAASLIRQDILVKTGIYDKLMNDFGEVELLDDVVDHWSSHVHVKEKAALLTKLAAFAKSRAMRVSLLSGDVHQCAIACINSKARPLQATDAAFMVQLISSAIGYVPPGDGVVRGVEFHVKNNRDITPGAAPEAALVESMGYLFRDGSQGVSKRFGNSNNFVEMVVAPEHGVPCLKCNYWVKGKKMEDWASSVKPHCIIIPPLLGPEAAAAAEALEMDVFDSEPSAIKACCFCMKK